jgi:hypothetical protein
LYASTLYEDLNLDVAMHDGAGRSGVCVSEGLKQLVHGPTDLFQINDNTYPCIMYMAIAAKLPQIHKAQNLIEELSQ